MQIARGIVGNAGRVGGSAEVNAPLGGDFAARGGLFYEDRGLSRFNADSRAFSVGACRASIAL